MRYELDSVDSDRETRDNSPVPWEFAFSYWSNFSLWDSKPLLFYKCQYRKALLWYHWDDAVF
jgi:hypothetical protein